MQVQVTLQRSTEHYSIAFGPLSDLPAALLDHGLRKGKCLLVTDTNVWPLYGNTVYDALQEAGWTVNKHVIPAGEESKSAGVLHGIYDVALQGGIDRQTPVFALGGGVVGDLAGFAAATILRGVPLVQIPTTLIAQADSAIGGKTGINHATGKNLIGAFYQPALVWMDTTTLQTLPEREWTSGLAEVIKYGCIADAKFLEDLDDHWHGVAYRERAVVQDLVCRSVVHKVQVVQADEKEAGVRAILNFGHTFGHAMERVAGYGVCTHGEAVAQGMLAALHLSQKLHPTLDISLAASLIQRLPAPNLLAAFNADQLVGAMSTDKKKIGNTLRFVLLDEIGHAYIDESIIKEQVIQAITQAAKERFPTRLS